MGMGVTKPMGSWVWVTMAVGKGDLNITLDQTHSISMGMGLIREPMSRINHIYSF
jgi:hypothetical protein